ncbi:MAG: hypothetical protein O2820_06230 [Planctomycetota bacterium]|nr:hypothetical protein [Planctomycetota bacterium]
MTKDEFRPLLLFLAKGCRTEFDRDQISAWFAALSDLPAEAVAVGIARFVCEVGKWPDIANVRRFADEALHGESKPWSKALEETRQAIRQYGLYGRGEALAKLDERTRQTIEALGGWRKICDWPCDQTGIQNAQFRDIYQDISRREDSRRALPADIRPKLTAAGSTDGAERWLSQNAGRWIAALTKPFSRVAHRGERTHDSSHTTFPVPGPVETDSKTTGPPIEPDSE